MKRLLLATLIVVLTACNSDQTMPTPAPTAPAANPGPEMPTPFPPPQPEPDGQRHLEVVPLATDGFPQFVVRQAGPTIVFSQIERGRKFDFRIRENGLFLKDLKCPPTDLQAVPSDHVSLFIPQDPDFAEIQTFCSSAHGNIWIEGTPRTGFSSGVAMPQGPTGTTRWEPVSGQLNSNGDLLLAVQADGSPDAGPRVGFTVGKYQTDGTLDFSLHVRGPIVVGKPMVSGSDIPRVLMVDPSDGSFYAAVNSLQAEALGNEDYIEAYIVKFRKDGTPETSFGKHGKLQILDNAYRVIIRSSFVDTTGHLLVAYDRCTSVNACETVLRRTDSYGSWDDDFGQHGRIDVSRSGVQSDPKSTIVPGPGGTIVYLEDYDHGSLAQNSVFITRYTDAGKPDPFFSPGMRTLQAPGLPQGKCGLSDAKTDSAGRLLLLGYCDSSHVALSRLLPNGKPDPSFGQAGNSCEPVQVGEFYSMMTSGTGPTQCELANPHGGRIALLKDAPVIVSPVASEPRPDPIGVGCNSAALGIGFYFFDESGKLIGNFTPPGFLRTWHEVPFDPARVAVITQSDPRTLLAVLGLGGDSYRAVGDPRPTTYFVRAKLP